MSGFVRLMVTLAVPAAIVVVLRAVARSVRSRNADWQTAADLLGLRPTPATLLLRRPEMAGSIDGHHTRVALERSDDATETVFSVSFRGARIKFRLRAKSGWTRLIGLIGIRDVEVGDAVFDEAVRVTTKHPDRLAAFLTPQRRAVAAAFLGEYRNSEIASGELRYRRRGTVRTDELVGTVEAMMAVARVFDAPLARRDVRTPRPVSEELDVIARADGVIADTGEDDTAAVRRDRFAVPPAFAPVAVDNLVAEVFAADGGVMSALTTFSNRYVGRPIAMSGEVLRVDAPSGTGRPGRIVIRMATLASGIYRGRDVEAHLSTGLLTEMPERGEISEVVGTLVRADPLMRRVYLEADAA